MILFQPMYQVPEGKAYGESSKDFLRPRVEWSGRHTHPPPLTMPTAGVQRAAPTPPFAAVTTASARATAARGSAARTPRMGGDHGEPRIGGAGRRDGDPIGASIEHPFDETSTCAPYPNVRSIGFISKFQA